MQRRKFLTASIKSSIAASALSAIHAGNAQAPAKSPREYYQIRKYELRNGPQTQLAETYFAQALIPALTRLGLGPIGTFSIDLGPETPSYYVLIPSSSLETLVTADLHLATDTGFLKLAEPFWSAPAAAPAFQRVESSLLSAFEGWPKLTSPAKGKRIFQLRTYESPSYRDHVNKVEMFHQGEFEIFKAAGFQSVFYGDTLIGPRMPSLTYMLSMESLDQLNTKWDAFRNHPDWKKLASDPRYSYEPTVSNITNLILNPLPSSQI